MGGVTLLDPEDSKIFEAAEKTVRFLEALGTGPEDRVFTDGMHDKIISTLGTVSALKVIGRSSVLSYRDPAFGIQGAIANDVAALLSVTLSTRKKTELTNRTDIDSRAYELYLRAKLLMDDLTPISSSAEWGAILQQLEAVTRLAPAFADAHALLARVQASF